MHVMPEHGCPKVMTRLPLRRAVQSRPHPRRRLILSDLEHPTSRLDLGASAPPSDEGTRESCIREVEGHRVVEHPTHSRGRHRLAVRATILVKPGGDLSMPLPEPSRRNREPDPHREGPLSRGNHFAGWPGIVSSSFVLTDSAILVSRCPAAWDCWAGRLSFPPCVAVSACPPM